MNILEDKILNLFYKLIEQLPAIIDNKQLYYNVDGNLVKISWFTKRESDKKSNFYSNDNEPFNKCSYRGVFSHSSIFWNIDNSPELEGYTFYIDTPAGQFKVPELSRHELVEVQEKIEEHFRVFPLKYLDDLCLVDPVYYGKVDKSLGSYDFVTR